MSGSAEKFVEECIAQTAVVVFSKSYCPFCTKAKAALEKAGVDKTKMRVEELETRADCANIQDYLLKKTGARSVPRVFINHQFFGGGDDTVAALESGKLETALKNAGALKA